nr:unnamed protein product [Callosobruchus analis]
MFRLAFLALLGAASAVDFEFKNNGGEIWVGILGNPDNWAGRFWGRTWCDQGSKHCLTGDCGNKLQCAGAGGVPPATLAEVTLKGDAGKDFYDISLSACLAFNNDEFCCRGAFNDPKKCKAGQYANKFKAHCPDAYSYAYDDRKSTFTSLLAATSAVEFEFKNNGGEIWRVVWAEENWAGRFWGRTWCNPGSQHCLTGDCGNRLECAGAGGVPPATLAEITLKGDAGQDFYDISLVDGYNIQMSMTPIGDSGDGSQYSCKRAGCDFNINNDCPDPLRVNSEHGIIACKSACLAFNNDEYCCRGAFNDPNKCRADEYANRFKAHCPDAYSYAYDDHKSTFTCQANRYLITFQ